MRVVVDNGPARKRKTGGRRKTAAVISLRRAVTADAPALHALITNHLEEGKLLPRTLEELAVHAPRFVVAVEPSADGDRIVGCAELAPLSSSVAEVRSLVVKEEVRRLGLGEQMVAALATRARQEGYTRLCAFAHEPAFFVRRGFSIVPHTWLPEKIAHDCYSCPLFRNCSQYAVMLDLDRQGVLGTALRTTLPAHA
ncbi:MAG TPA: GNAT family N-acetyltransferase [Vicinamibacterales bacterium]|nr:GNAT family N-acetyltransferase [Vicinamibacterales bacterium]